MQSKESNIKLLLLGRAVSLFGNTIYLIVLPLYILNITQNLKTTGIFFAAVNFPTIIISIFIGTIEKSSFFKDFKEGINYIKNNKIIFNFFILVMFLNFFIANNDEIINPGILIKKYGISEKLFGFSATSYGVGSVFAGIFIYYNKKFSFLKKLKLLFILNSSLMCLGGLLSIILFRYNHYIYFTIFIFFQFLIGMITTFVNVPLISFFQKNVEIEYQSRFFSILSFFSGGLIPLGILYAGYLSSYIGADVTYMINNVAIIIIVCLVFNNIKEAVVN